MNTLNEIAAALNDDAAFNTTVTNAIATKLPLGGGTMTGNLIVNASLDISGDIDVDGTTNLDVVDIDGAVDMASTLTVSGLTNLKSPVQVRNATQNFNGGLSAEVNSGIINFGINEGSGNRFGGSYTQANQGGMLNFDTRAGNPLFQIYGRTAGTATATGSILFQIDSTGNTVVNEAGADADFRVESNDNANMLFVDGGNNRVGIGAPPSAPFTVSAADGTLAVFTNTTSADLAIKTASGVLLITPSTGTLAFGTSNTERMRINSSGNVGINWTGSTARLGIIQSGSSTPGMNITDGTSSDFMVYAGHSSGIARIGPSTGQLAIQTGGTERMRIASNGRISMGTTTANAGLTVANGDIRTTAAAVANDANSFSMSQESSGGTLCARGANGSTRGTIQLTVNKDNGGDGIVGLFIANDGNPCVGKTSSDINTQGFHIISSGTYAGTVYSGITGSTAGSTYHVRDTTNNAWKFYVTNAGVINATSTSITGLSDERLKENIVDLETGLSEVMFLKPRRFDWKEGEGSGAKNVAGFIAQEVETVLPDLIEDFMHDDLDDAKSIRMGDMLPTLVKAIQEQQTLIESLTARIETLEG
jgi:hypothetical protein